MPFTNPQGLEHRLQIFCDLEILYWCSLKKKSVVTGPLYRSYMAGRTLIGPLSLEDSLQILLLLEKYLQVFYDQRIVLRSSFQTLYGQKTIFKSSGARIPFFRYSRVQCHVYGKETFTGFLQLGDLLQILYGQKTLFQNFPGFLQQKDVLQVFYGRRTEGLLRLNDLLQIFEVQSTFYRFPVARRSFTGALQPKCFYRSSIKISYG